MFLSRPILYTAVAALALAGSAYSQNAISAKAGMINVADGDVFLLDAKGGEPRKVEPKITEFIEIKEGQTLKSGEGRAEVLLVPGTFLRMAEESSFRLTSNKLSDARLEMLTGSGLLEVSENMEDSKVTIVTGDAIASISRAGIYRVEPGRIQVYMGEAQVSYGNGQTVALKGGKELVAGAGGWTVAKFDAKDTDPLYRWAKRRSSYIAMANVSAARQATPQSNGLRTGFWQMNPYFGFATYIPYSGTARSPFGYYYYTPYSVMDVYFPPNYGYNGHSGSGYAGNPTHGIASSMPERSASSSGYSPSAGISSGSVSSGSAGAGSTGSRSGGASSGGSAGGAVSGGTSSGGSGGSRGGRGN